MPDYKKRFGDRYDGRRLRSLDPFYRIIPFIMKNRVDSQNYFEEKIEISRAEAFLRKKRKTSETNIGMLHLLVAAMVRTIALRPALNRFIAGQRIYARNEILVSIAIKKELKAESPETTIKFKFEPTDTLIDIAKKMNKKIEENKALDSKNATDKTAKLIMLCPNFIVRFIVFLISLLDNFGLVPKIINEVSPFHTTFFITDLGSLGIGPIYHHLYNFGTTSIFVSFGTKFREKVIDSKDNIVDKKYLGVKISTDERIVDGHYYASAFKLFKTFINNPDRLDVPPEKVESDVE